MLSEVNSITFNRVLSTEICRPQLSTSSFLGFILSSSHSHLPINANSRFLLFFKYQCTNMQAALRLLSSTFYSLDLFGTK